jgi:hypothetical protein
MDITGRQQSRLRVAARPMPSRAFIRNSRGNGEMENGTATTNQRRLNGAELSRRISLVISGILVTLAIVFMIVNYQRWMTIDF